jgi:hypothetical protein
VAFDSGGNAYTRVVREKRGGARSDLISAPRRGAGPLPGTSRHGGITAFGTNRGIITFVNSQSGSWQLWYRNNNSGNIDELTNPVGAEITEVYTSARANFVAFSSAFPGFPFDANGPTRDVFFKHLREGESL